MGNDMNNFVKAIFFDIDGTLVSHAISDIPKGVLESFSQMQKRGIRLFLATGRHISEFKSLPLHDYPFDGYVTQTGQICYDRDFNLVCEEALTDEDTKILTRLFDEKEIPIVLLNQDSLYINFVNKVVVDTQEKINTLIPKIDTYHGEKLFGAKVFGTADQTAYIAAQLPGCKESSWNRYASDIVLKEAGKVRGIKRMLEQYGIDQKETMAFGDAENDIDMIRFAQIGVAMGNAANVLKSSSDYVTASVDDDGILKALAHYELI